MRHHHFAGGNLLFARAHKAQFAAPQCIPISHSHRWPKHPAGHWPPCIYIAQPGRRIQCRTWRLIRKPLKPRLLLVRRSQYTRPNLSRKLGPILFDPHCCTFHDLGSPCRIFLAKGLHACLQPARIQCIDRKCPVAALRTSRPASQPGPRPTRSIRQRCIHNLYELRISRRPHAPRIAENAMEGRRRIPRRYRATAQRAITASRHPATHPSGSRCLWAPHPRSQ